MKFKDKFVSVFCASAIFFANVSVSAGLVDNIEVTGNTLSLSGSVENNDVVAIYKMNGSEKTYGRVESAATDFLGIKYITPDKDGRYTYSEIFDDNNKTLYISNIGGESKLIRVNDYIDDVYKYQVFISPNGDDTTATGTFLQPYASIKAAQKAVEAIQNSDSYNGGDIAVNFIPGVYRVGSTSFGTAQSGTSNGRIVYRAYGGDVIFKNSKEINIKDLKQISDENIIRRLPISSAGKVMELDLSKYLGETDYIGYGYIDNMGSANFGRRGMTRLFLNGKPQTVSRWPNSGYKDFLLKDGSSSVVNSGKNTVEDENGEIITSYNDIILRFDDANMLRWTDANDMVIRGYFPVGYHGNSYDVKSIDADNKQITLKNNFSNGLTIDDTFDGQRRWYAENLLEEIDMPGEYYIDEAAKKLYYYPSYALSDNDTLELVAGKSGANLFSLNNASYISFEGLTFEQVNYKAIVMSASTHIIINKCNFGYTRSNAVQCNSGCENITVKNSVFYYTAGSAVYMGLNLTEEQISEYKNSGIVIDNNHIYKVGENSQYPFPAIHSDGICDVVINNTIHFTPINGIEFSSPGGQFINNEIYRAVYDGTDSGAMHIGGEWRRYGINIEYNYIHNLGVENYPDGHSSWPVAGIYWDEAHSGTTQNNNIIVNDFKGAAKGIFMNGGRDHTAKGNIIVGVESAFQNSNPHSSYYLGYGEDLWPYHKGLNNTYENFLNLYSIAKQNNSPYYQIYGEKMEELKQDIENNGRFDAKNLDFEGNVLVDCDNESVLGKDTNGDGKADGSLSGPVEARKYFYNSETNKYEYKIISIDNSDTVNIDNYKAADGTSRENIFVDPQNGDYRVSKTGKAALGIDDSFKLDESFDLSSIGCQTSVEIGQSFKKLYPVNGETITDSQSINLCWEPSLFADEYEYSVYDKDGNKVAGGTTMYTNAMVEGLSGNTKYSWEVSAKYCSAIDKARNMGYTVWDSEGGRYEFETSPYDVTVLNVSLSMDKGSLYYDVINNSDDNVSAKLIFAKYEGSKLIWCKAENIIIEKGEVSKKTVNSNISDKSGIRVFIWSDDGTIKPLFGNKIYLN